MCLILLWSHIGKSDASSRHFTTWQCGGSSAAARARCQSWCSDQRAVHTASYCCQGRTRRNHSIVARQWSKTETENQGYVLNFMDDFVWIIIIFGHGYISLGYSEILYYWWSCRNVHTLNIHFKVDFHSCRLFKRIVLLLTTYVAIKCFIYSIGFWKH